MNDADYIYLTYAHQDTGVADRVATELRLRGTLVWRDTEQISPGTSWIEESKIALIASRALLFLSSRHSNESTFALTEVDKALETGKKVIPIAVDETAIETAPIRLRNIQFIDLWTDFDRGMNRVLTALNFIRKFPPANLASIRPKTKGYVFLSYAEDDSEFLDELKPFFKDHGYAYWDYRESDRDYHGPLFIELEGVIKEAKATVSVLSESWRKSKWVIREYFYSEEIEKPVLLLKAKSMPPTLAVSGVPYIDFQGDRSVAIEKLRRELERKGL